MNGLPLPSCGAWTNRRGTFTDESQTCDETSDSVNAVGGGCIPTLLFEGGGVDGDARRRAHGGDSV